MFPQADRSKHVIVSKFLAKIIGKRKKTNNMLRKLTENIKINHFTALRPLLAALGPLLVALGPLLAALGPLMATLGPLLDALGRSWAAPGPLLGRSWPPLAALGALLGALGPLSERHAKIIPRSLPKIIDFDPPKPPKITPKSHQKATTN